MVRFIGSGDALRQRQSEEKGTNTKNRGVDEPKPRVSRTYRLEYRFDCSCCRTSSREPGALPEKRRPFRQLRRALTSGVGSPQTALPESH